MEGAIGIGMPYATIPPVTSRLPCLRGGRHLLRDRSRADSAWASVMVYGEPLQHFAATATRPAHLRSTDRLATRLVFFKAKKAAVKKAAAKKVATKKVGEGQPATPE